MKTYTSEIADRYLEEIREFADKHYKNKTKFSMKEIVELLKKRNNNNSGHK